jgi:hypothetical protein
MGEPQEFPLRTREDWLHAAVERLRPLYTGAGCAVPGVLHLSMGFPSTAALARTRRRIGECWSGAASLDGHHHLFLSPVLAEPAEILGVLAHELVHAAVGVKAGHGPIFRRAALAIGLAGPMRSTTAGPALASRLAALASGLGPFPHAGLVAGERKKQGTRLLKIECPDCGYLARVSAHWIAIGLPVCPCGTTMRLNTPAE